MNGKRALKIALRVFIKTILVIAIFIGVGVGSFHLTNLFFKATERDERSTKYEHVIAVNPSSESANLIYSHNKKENEIKAIVLELFDQETGNLDYVTIPNKTQISLSPESYESYKEVSKYMPQIVTMRDICKYFEGDVAYEYGIMLLQEELDVEIGYFTALDSVEFNKRFEKKDDAFRPSQAYMDAVGANKDKESLTEFLESEWDNVISDITLDQKLKYVDSYLKINPKNIYAHRAYAEEMKGVALLDAKRTSKLINGVWDQGARKSTQTSADGGKKSKVSSVSDKSIQITNGSQIDGLALKYKNKLEADGLSIAGIGNYSGGLQTHTIIYGNKKKWAKALASYFKDPIIEQGEDLTNSADIEIVIGTEDDIKE
ncbi:LytR C-terminal domain-containing protein [Eubacterium xylanophilum]|uniref:LytR C-terminal domain-containing protein n=1 Tax=Eubacterium xylanophilum TaxID=39497 RepID=UPI00047E5ADC|nr:LytR C-terminal domain-containing protein [Eubacterium xylanophilum]